MINKEIKPCWKCKKLLTINEYGYAVCDNYSQHKDGFEAVIFGDKDHSQYKEATEPDPEAWRYRKQGLTYQQSYYWRITKKKRLNAMEQRTTSTL